MFNLQPASRDGRAFLSIIINLAGSTTTRIASGRLAANSIIRAMRFPSDASMAGVMNFNLRLATAETLTPAAADFSGGSSLMPTIGANNARARLHPDAEGAAPWWPVNIRLGGSGTRLLIEAENNNISQVNVIVQAIIDLTTPREL